MLQLEAVLETIYDWVCVAIFGGLVVLFLDRSTEENPPDHLWQYLAASVGCAVANYLGNNDYPIPAMVVLATVLTFIWMVLKPLARLNRD